MPGNPLLPGQGVGVTEPPLYPFLQEVMEKMPWSLALGEPS